MLYQQANGGIFLNWFEDRICEEASYIITHKATVRDAAKALCIGKSTIHKDVTDRLKSINPGLYGSVREVLNTNKAERHLRGGKATHDKYASLRQCAGDITADR
ncbi:MAG: sporulation transcriptional regulator SpoIIID [Clostridia bacterium]|nr:sporulation transcriptional regulator SpoIIID [Clostridia bacterium]